MLRNLYAMSLKIALSGAKSMICCNGYHQTVSRAGWQGLDTQTGRLPED